MTAVAACGEPDVGTPACAHSSCLPHTTEQQQQLQVHANSYGHRVRQRRVLLAAPLLVLLLLLSPPHCTSSRRGSGMNLLPPTPLPHLSYMCEALMLRGDNNRCGGDHTTRSNTSRSAYSVVSTQRQMAFIPHNFTLTRMSSQSDALPASALCSGNSACNTSTSGRTGIRRAVSNTRTSKQPSSTSCYAYQLTFGKEKEPGRVALVTGASRGIGKTIAETLAEGGVAHVLCVARNQDACDEVASGLVARGFSASGHGVDVGDAAAVENLCNTLLEKYPRIDILVNNAGITRDNLFIRMTPQEWNDVINVNLNSAFYFTSPLIKRMVKNRFGRIINMSSVVGVGGNVGQANYAASKAGLIGMTRSLGKEYANRGVTVNAVAPGFIRSTMTDAMTDAAKAATIASIPAGRMGDPQDVANMVAFLASDQAAYVTGKVMPVDGGMLFGAN